MDTRLSQKDAWERVEQAYARYETVAMHRDLGDAKVREYRREYMEAVTTFNAVLAQRNRPHSADTEPE